MPIYTYLCKRDHQIDVWHGINEPPHTRCTMCKSAARRIIAPTSGHVVEPSGIYQPFSDMRFDPKTKRLGEEKITKRAYEKQDREHRERMMQISKRGPKLNLEPKKTQATWY